MDGFSIVFFLSSEWSHYHRPGLLRAMARAQADHGPVLVVNNPVCPLSTRWHRPQRWQQWCARDRQTPPLQTIADNLVLLDARVALHDKLASGLPGAGHLNRHLLAPQVNAAMAALDMRHPRVSWFQFPTFCHYPGLLQEQLAVYECYDEHADVPGLSAYAKRRVRGLEKRLLQACDLVFTTSLPLYETRRALHPNVALTYNGADLEFFAPIGQDSMRRAAQSARRAPTVGYLGTLHEHTDLALLADMAQRCPDWRLVLIGPVQKGADAYQLARLRASSNVTLHGWVEEGDLVRLLREIDVGVIPYRSEAVFNRYVNPNKLHEYTAMGKPVVASPGIDVSSHTGMVRTAQGGTAFIEAVRQAHATNTPTLVQERLQFAIGNSWDARAALMLGHIHRTLHARPAASLPHLSTSPP